MSWITLSTEDAKAFIESVKSKGEKLLFEPSICDVYALPLDFYDGYSLYRIANKYTIPYAQLDFLSNGEDHYYLDGSEDAFHNLNARGAISLDRENAFHYLSLYISYVYERGNSMGFLGDFETSTVIYNAASHVYEISTPLSYQDSVVQGEIEVSDGGLIHVKKPVDVSFLAAPKPKPARGFTHPYAEQIIERTKTLLSHTARGQELLNLLEKMKPNVKIISSPNYQGFCANTRSIYMFMPAEEQTAKYLQAIMMAGCIRDMEQILDGCTHPHPTKNEEVYGDVNLAKNLDMIIEMCKIVEELEDLNIAEGLHDFSKMGFGGVYHAYKTGSNDDALLDVYLTALKERNIIG